MKLKSMVNKKLYDKYFENPPTRFECENGTIILPKIIVKNILVSIRHLTQEFDALMLFVGREGSGKSLFMRQVLYCFWWFLTKFEMVDYPFNLSLVHFGIKELQEDRVKYDLELNEKFRISDLDESKDDLGRDKYNTPEAKGFMDYIRRCRDESGIIALAQPQLSEFLPAIVMSRALFVFEVDYDIDQNTADIVRGDFKLITIPRGKDSFSSYHNKYISKKYIKMILSSYINDSSKRYDDLPENILTYSGKFNAVDPINKKAYLMKKKTKKWERIYKEKDNKKNLQLEVNHLRKMKEYFLGMLRFVKENHFNEDGRKITDKQVAEILNISPRTVSRHIREYKGIDV